METNRRDFLACSALAALGAAAGGCATDGGRCACGGGAGSLVGFRTKPMDRIRVGFIGVGERGMAALHRVMLYPGVETAAICDLRTEAADDGAAFLRKWKLPGAAHLYKGAPDSWKGLCEDPEVDVVYIATPQRLHAEQELYALRHGKHVLCEVPGAETIEQCWAIVEAAEKAQRHCFLLENRCFREMETLALSLAKRGMLGELAYAEGAYIHNLTARGLENSFRNQHTRKVGSHGRNWNTYPTHPLGPICRYLDINRGDRMTTLVSMSTDAFTAPAFSREHYAPDAWQNKIKYRGTDMNTTLIRTAKGRTIELKFCLVTPRPYTRINLLAGTKGCFQGEPFEITFCDKAGDGGHEWFGEERREEVRREYAHPMWRQLGKVVAELGTTDECNRFLGGHGGPDYLMDLAWIYALRRGDPMPQDVYDLATWSSIVELSRMSVQSNSTSMEVPDFTRGGWSRAEPQALADFDLGSIGLDMAAFRSRALLWSGANKS